MTDDELSKIVQQYPALFSYNIDNNLEPKLNFYINALGDENEALALVTRIPALFGYSLENRLKPRLQEALDVGMQIDSKCLNTMMINTNEKWKKRLSKERC